MWRLLRGVVNAKVSETIGEEAVKAREAALATQRDDWNATFAEIADGRRAEAESWKTDHKSAGDAAEALDKEHREKLSAHKETMETTEQVFAERLRLEAPASYWRTKHKRHKIEKLCYLVLFFATDILVFFMACWFFQISWNLLMPQ